jgi:diaminohydroxyphosphoribosylaminopyrimidine deaminase / 5-amino-6-(5-phosphoribosylamino)uracil reductase
MRRALRLAKKGRGNVLPNPMVGAVIIKDDERIGEGYHAKFGEEHAEIAALNSCTQDPTGATLYVTLEPCSKEGKTPACTKAIIKAGIKKVVIAAKDPSQNGTSELEKAGIEVETGILEDAAKDLNKAFFTFHEKNRPFVTLKVAMSLDGKVAEARGIQTQITGEKAQKRVHIFRKNHQAILVGAGTVLTDNPHLGVRLVEGNDPLRIILAGDTALPENLKVFRDDNFILLKNKSIKEILEELHKQNIISVLVEGGPTVFTEFLKAQAVDEIQLLMAPKTLGQNALNFLEENNNISLSIRSVRKLSPDVLITATPKWDSNNG